MRKDESNDIWEGGSKDPNRKAISVLDLIRVAQLYPLNDGGKAIQAAEVLQSTGWEETQVTVGTIQTGVKPAETPILAPQKQGIILSSWCKSSKLKPPSS